MAATIVWLRQDLRLDDNPAFAAAAARRGPVIPVYIWSPREEGNWPPGAASRWWLHHSLTALNQDLRSRGSRLVVRQGDSSRVLAEVAEAGRADCVVWNRRYEPAALERDAQVKAELTDRGLHVEECNGSLLFDVAAIRNRQGAPFQVFTPFWENCLGLEEPGRPHGAPRQLAAPKRWPVSDTIESLELLPKLDWTAGLAAAWTPGEASARRTLQRFAGKSLGGYGEDRDRPDLPGTSRLSPHLHWGEIGPRRVWHAVRKRMSGASGSAEDQGGSSFLRELGWREFAYHLLVHFPHTPEEPLRGKFADVPWEHDRRLLRAWQRGRTGYPLVDAGMRQLWRTGWMHNRVRMVVASFLVKHLLISWQTGARWFWDTLVDADLANNTLGWQWAAGCGADAAPYFRVFNPSLQARKFDPQGRYIHEFVPELTDLSPAPRRRGKHEPSLFEAQQSSPAYPAPIVDHKAARERFLAAMSRLG